VVSVIRPDSPRQIVVLEAGLPPPPDGRAGLIFFRCDITAFQQFFFHALLSSLSLRFFSPEHFLFFPRLPGCFLYPTSTLFRLTFPGFSGKDAFFPPFLVSVSVLLAVPDPFGRLASPSNVFPLPLWSAAWNPPRDSGFLMELYKSDHFLSFSSIQ